ncbi:unnamed protein product [Amoebophrya sp. A25]|nr:unnamed protein product [Amoebophrya sp. A25]|eukprot:GSA25T00012152001.1
MYSISESEVKYWPHIRCHSDTSVMYSMREPVACDIFGGFSRITLIPAGSAEVGAFLVLLLSGSSVVFSSSSASCASSSASSSSSSSPASHLLYDASKDATSSSETALLRSFRSLLLYPTFTTFMLSKSASSGSSVNCSKTLHPRSFAM